MRAQPQSDAALAEPSPEDKKEEEERWPGRVDAPQAEIDSSPPLAAEQLKQAYPDLEAQAIPGVQLGIFVGANMPFQPIGFSLRSDVYF